MSAIVFKSFTDVSALAEAATRHLSQALQTALKDRGKASLMLSGGSSPVPVYKALSKEPLAWDGVGVSLVDERWVPNDSPGSNARLIRDCFEDTAAQRALFVPLYNAHETSSKGVTAAEQALALISHPFDACVMGMGKDGHTASWFPNSTGLKEALDPDNKSVLASIDATSCPGAGDYSDRITLTFSAVANVRDVILLLPDPEKVEIFQTASGKTPEEAPVRALYGLGAKLTVYALEASS